MNVSTILENNKNEVLRTIVLNKSLLSRADISRMIGLNKASVSRIINELIEENIIYELKKGDSTIKGGKKPLLIDVNYKNIFVAIYLLRNEYAYIFTNIKGRDIKSGTYKPNSKLAFLKNIEKFFHLLQKETSQFNILACNLIVPGIVDSDSLMIIYSGEFDISDLSLAPLIKKYFKTHFFLENDANAAAVGYKFFEYSNASDFIFLLLRIDRTKSILYSGCGIILNNKLIKGNNNFGGEFLLFETDVDRTVVLNDNYWKLKQKYENQLLEYIMSHLFFLNPSALVIDESIQYNINGLLYKIKKSIKNIQKTYTGFDANVIISRTHKISLHGGIAILIDKFINLEFTSSGTQTNDKIIKILNTKS